ncbi:hypothetical protein Q6D67_13415 [Haliea sp. E1-2-M8]|nr:hypothetical protein [Haliea sp. E1-2-M8]
MTTLAFDSLRNARKPGEADGGASRGSRLMRGRGWVEREPYIQAFWLLALVITEKRLIGNILPTC